MSLVHPKNPRRWADGSKRSIDNGFVLGFSGVPIDWAPLQRSAVLRSASTRKVENARARGTDFSTIHGISKKSDAILSARRKYSAPVEGAEAGQRSADKRDALRRGGR
ncbi:hypothetical protein LJR084_001885 [Variovorax sp. LjRoot84]|uniref:hypothetical protein n=1 Tax=Variovorax sp. LjRoot84 TaxID=3342340 RepID=UPI003ED09EA1